MAINENQPIMVSKIAIIGAGVSGIAAAKQLSHHNPIVFEASDSIGGVWKHCSFNSTKLQSQRRDYEFADFPWPERDNPEFPSHSEILEYLHTYAEHFDVLKNIRFNSKVVELRFAGNREVSDLRDRDYGTILPGHPVWEVAVQTNQSQTIQVFSFTPNSTSFNSLIYLGFKKLYIHDLIMYILLSLILFSYVFCMSLIF